MSLVDANLLLYAVIREYPQHRKAKTWLDNLLRKPERVALPWASMLAFFRIATNPRVFTKPLRGEQAWQVVSLWLAHPHVWIPIETEQHPQLLGGLLIKSQATAGLVHDASLAALAMSHGLTLYSTDGDFSRFPGLQWVNPLQ